MCDYSKIVIPGLLSKIDKVGRGECKACLYVRLPIYSHVVVLVVEMVVDVEVLDEVVVVVVEVEVEVEVESGGGGDGGSGGGGGGGASGGGGGCGGSECGGASGGVGCESGGSSSRAIELDHIKEVIEEVSAVPEVKEKKKSRNALRKGSEGSIAKLGFYSGEEDMEFSSFSSGTKRAVKTWQASLDAPQDGIVTAELEQLYTVAQIEGLDNKGSTLTTTQKEDTNGAAVTSGTEISEVQQTLVKEGVTKVEVSEHRVFLLGENRWEDSSRLSRNQTKVGESKTMNTTTRCLTCREEGRLLCTECDGTGEPNIEEQFLDWVEEGAKCPYCEGHGFTICDVCEGATVA
ncbi:hypothetical protein L3X38_016472 [Prunus dulcis]|uniref:Peptidoglycan binding-like domain-containing protein n=1 Tax=Prunus dulcis TaxID=3755 RepID=A0AAD4W5G2_PRUDU|nr:hypothetical protein L3X38_016472 [Prunus dulcis]